MNKYRNKMTGHVIKTAGQVHGDSWELLQQEQVPETTEVPTSGQCSVDPAATQPAASKKSLKSAKTHNKK